MDDKNIILKSLNNLQNKMNNASGDLFERLKNIEIENEIQDELIGSDFIPIEKNEEIVLTCGSARIYEMPKD